MPSPLVIQRMLEPDRPWGWPPIGNSWLYQDGHYLKSGSNFVYAPSSPSAVAITWLPGFDNGDIPEGTAIGTTVATLAVTDLDKPNDTHTFTLVVNENSALQISGANLQTANYMQGTEHAPTGITITWLGGFTDGAVPENTAVGTALATLATTDANLPNDAHVYTLVVNEDSKLQIDGASIELAAALDYETETEFDFTVRSTDSSGLTVDQANTITVTNTVEGALLLLAGETDGFASDFTYPIDASRNAKRIASVDTEYTNAGWWTNSSASTKWVRDNTGAWVEIAAGAIAIDHQSNGTPIGALFEPARTNLLLNNATLSTQSVTVTNVPHTLSFFGTGTVTLSGVSTAGPLVGTGADNRVSLTFTPTAGSLTLTVSGTVTKGQLEIGSNISSPIVTAGTAVTRAADIPNFALASLGMFSATDGMVVVDATFADWPDAANALAAYLFTLFTGTTEYIRLIVNDSGSRVKSLNAQARDNTTAVALGADVLPGNHVVANTRRKYGMTWNTSTQMAAANGSLIGSDAAMPAVMPTLTTFYAGGFNAGPIQPMHIHAITYLPRRSNADLATRTA